MTKLSKQGQKFWRQPSEVSLFNSNYLLESFDFTEIYPNREWRLIDKKTDRETINFQQPCFN